METKFQVDVGVINRQVRAGSSTPRVIMRRACVSETGVLCVEAPGYSPPIIPQHNPGFFVRPMVLYDRPLFLDTSFPLKTPEGGCEARVRLRAEWLFFTTSSAVRLPCICSAAVVHMQCSRHMVLISNEQFFFCGIYSCFTRCRGFVPLPHRLSFDGIARSRPSVVCVCYTHLGRGDFFAGGEREEGGGGDEFLVYSFWRILA